MFASVFLLNIVYFSVCLTSNKLYWIDDQLADVSTRFYTSVSWSVGELTGYPTGSVLDLQQQAYLRLALTVCKDYNANDEFIELVFRADYRWQNITYIHLINARV